MRAFPFPILLVSIVLLSCEDEEATSVQASEAGAIAQSEEPEDAGSDAGHDAGPPRPPARIFARRFVSKIRERPDRESFRVGYLRAGAVMDATTADPVRVDDPRCSGGWYELTTGGFVCNGRDVIAFWGRRLPQHRGAQPDRVAPLPYRYGRNRMNNAPMYRVLPTDENAAEFEGYRIPGVEPPPSEDGEPAGDDPGGQAAPDPAPTPAPAPVPAPTPAPPAPERAAPPPDSDPVEGVEDAEEPITLESLRGSSESALLRRLAGGFIVSLDADFRAGGGRRRYWRTINNGFVPYRAIAQVSYPEFRGERLDDTMQLPVAYVLGRNESFYLRTPDGRARRGRPVDFHHRLDIVGEETIGGTPYFVAADGRLYRERDVRSIRGRERPDGVAEGEKWIEVNLPEQYLIAYEHDRPVYVTLISSGRAYHPDDPDANFLTPTGLYRIRAKHLAATMDGDTAVDGPYSIDDVPWVMYFELAYALHGAFWHNAFGFPRSHGCVNLAPRDAQWVFNWSDPQVPQGWHGAYPTEQDPGTWVYIHGETPGQRAN